MHNLIEYKWYLNRSIWPKDRTQTGTSTFDQCDPGSNGMDILFVKENNAIIYALSVILVV